MRVFTDGLSDTHGPHWWTRGMEVPGFPGAEKEIWRVEVAFIVTPRRHFANFTTMGILRNLRELI